MGDEKKPQPTGGEKVNKSDKGKPQPTPGEKQKADFPFRDRRGGFRKEKDS